MPQPWAHPGTGLCRWRGAEKGFVVLNAIKDFALVLAECTLVAVNQATCPYYECVFVCVCIYIYTIYKLAAGSLEADSASFQLEGNKPTASCTGISSSPRMGMFLGFWLGWCWAGAGLVQQRGQVPGATPACLPHRRRLRLVQPASLSKTMIWQILAPDPWCALGWMGRGAVAPRAEGITALPAMP